MKADRKHVHYRLMDMGFSKKQTVAVLYVWSLILGLTAVAITTTGLGKALMVLLALGAAAIVTFKLFLSKKK